MLAKAPLAIDLFCGLFGWSEGFAREGWDVIGFDLEDMHSNFGLVRPPEFRLVLQNVLTLHGSQFKDAALIVASPPCQAYSYMAMPWSRAKTRAAAIRSDATGEELRKLNELFNACFRIQREACEAAGRHVPMVVENVRGAIPWVGRSRWNHGSFHLWADVPALMPITRSRKLTGFRFDGSGRSFQSASVEQTGIKAPGMNWSNPELRGQDFTRIAGRHAMEGIKGVGPSWDSAKGCGAHGMARWTNPAEGIKCGGDWFNAAQPSISRLTSSKSPARKAASAMIAKIPLALSRHIASVYRPALSAESPLCRLDDTLPR